jgi:hypothetical protein
MTPQNISGMVDGLDMTTLLDPPRTPVTVEICRTKNTDLLGTTIVSVVEVVIEFNRSGDVERVSSRLKTTQASLNGRTYTCKNHNMPISLNEEEKRHACMVALCRAS